MKNIQHKNTTNQRGAVSLFVVIFTALLITTITISFMQLMVRDQQQATYSDLSDSAYDSAIAGVEDAKRALLARQECGDDGSPRCVLVRDAIGAGECNTLHRIYGGDTNGETMIQQDEGDRRLEQAYTCVKITSNTEDYLGTFDSANTATVIPLRSVNSFDRIKISWYLSESGGNVNLPEMSGNNVLPPVGDESTRWPEDRPALLRAQLINGGDHNTFRLSDFNSSTYSNTLFLMPARAGSEPFDFAGLDGRQTGNAMPQGVTCRSSVESGRYACEATITINEHENGRISANRQTVFLNLAAFYRSTDYKVELFMGGQRIAFAGVQPEVDSAGRANDLVRRVVSRVEMGNTFNYPVAALETSGNLCKDFSVTTDERDYDSSNTTCEP